MSETIYESGEYLASNPDWHAGDAPHKARWVAGILERHGLVPRHLVEIGSGSGEMLVELARRYPDARLEGFDISPQAHAIAAPKGGGSLAFHRADYFAASNERADVLMAIDVIEHVEDYMGFVRAMRPRAEWKLFHIPLDLSAQGLLRAAPMIHTRRAFGHLHSFCKDTALATLSDCGHEIVEWTYTYGAETMPKGGLRTRMLNIPRRLTRLIDEDFAVRLLGGASILALTR